MKNGWTSILRTVELLAHRHPRLGPACWALAVQYFVAQVAVALAARSAYNWRTDTISYLGITQCGTYGGEYVCSPLHALFNYSLIALGVAMAAGTFLVYHQFDRNTGTLAGFGALAVAAGGTLLVGLFPANTLGAVHHLGSGLSFIGGLVGVFTLSISLHGLPRVLRHIMLGSAAAALLGVILLTVVFFSGFGLKSVAERMTSYPEVVWLVVFGLYYAVCQPPHAPRGQRR